MKHTKATEMSPDFSAPIAEEIWQKKYQLKRADGEVVDHSVKHTWSRVAGALSKPELDEDHWYGEFFEALRDFKYLPAGRIIAGAGTGRNVTLSNCFTMGTIPDSLPGIFDMLKEAALTMQQGGGIGYDFSTIRPKGAPVKGVESDASGPLSFMDCWDAMCRTIMSAGSRRGAMMATMRCDHPDIRDFITAKQDPTRLRMFNMSVLVTDDFMEAVRTDADFPLVHEKAPVGAPVMFEGSGLKVRPGGNIGEHVHEVVSAREIWDLIMRSTYDYAEPGVIFIDRVNQDHNLNYLETIATTNPCGEKPMGPYASCLLGSVNLARLVKEPFSEDASISIDELQHLVRRAIRMMDNVIEAGNFPLPEQLQKAKDDRQLGLGITGLADALIMCGFEYGTEEAREQAAMWMRIINEAAYAASIDLAKEKGSFPNFDADAFLAPGTHASRLPQHLKDGINEHGIRNALLTSIAPTGTISLYAGNVSSGIEPVFAASYMRKILEKDGTRSEQRVVDYAVQLWEEMGNEGLPPAYVDAQTLSPDDHIYMQAALQQHVDSSISKTINLPEDISFEDFKDVYSLSYDLGCKGCTTYRPNDVTGSVISIEEAPKAEEEAPVLIQEEAPVERPDALVGSTYKIKWPSNEHAIYVTINDIEDRGNRRPFEIFISSKNMEHFAWTVALTRMISAVFRRPHDSTFVVEELKAVFDPRGGAWVQGKYVPSILAAIGGVIEQHMKLIGYIATDQEIIEERPSGAKVTMVPELCPKCSVGSMVHQGGCKTCDSCGDSACG